MNRYVIVIIFLLFARFLSFASVSNDEQIDSYISFISSDLERHRAYLQNYYDKILYAIYFLGSLIVFFLGFLQWRTHSDVKRSVRKFWENNFRLEFDNQVENLRNKITTLQSQLEEEQERLKQAQDNITLHNKMIFENANKTSDVISSNNKGYYKILWVDDNPKNNYALIDLFEDNKIKSIIKTSTKDAIEYLKLNDYRDISAIITDMKRGKLIDEGIKLIREVRLRFGNIPTIVYTSSKTSNDLKIEAQQLGAKFTTNPSKLVNYVYSILLKNDN